MSTLTEAASALAPKPVVLRIPSGALQGWLFEPPSARAALVIGVPRPFDGLSAAERSTAALLARSGYRTLLLALRAEDDSDGATPPWLQVPMLALRLSGAGQWLTHHERRTRLPLAWLGVGLASPAALVATALDGGHVFALATCGGHPERAGASVFLTRVPMLFLVPPEDEASTGLATPAREPKRLHPLRELRVLPGDTATNLGHPAVAEACRDWFNLWLERASEPAAEIGAAWAR